MKQAKEFSFAEYASEFDRHIGTSIRGYEHLKSDCVSFSQYFIQDNTTVLDIGCSSGALLQAIRKLNEKRHPSVQYIGLDIEKRFRDHWLKRRALNLKLKQCDVRTYDGFKKLSLVYSLFTLQFLPERDRLKLVKRIYNGLVEGGALILSEKVLAKNAKIQDMLAFTYYDFKRKAFSASEILDKEKSIRDQMHLWSEYKLFEMLRSADSSRSICSCFGEIIYLLAFLR